MDAICSRPVNELYDRAIELNIPFHQWGSWIERELTSDYLKSMCKEKAVSAKTATKH